MILKRPESMRYVFSFVLCPAISASSAAGTRTQEGNAEETATENEVNESPCSMTT